MKTIANAPVINTGKNTARYMARNTAMNIALMISLLLAAPAFAGSEGHATGGIAENRHQSASTEIALHTPKIDVSVPLAATKPYLQQIELMKNKTSPEFSTASPTGFILTSF